MGKKVVNKNIVVVGGGTSGWLTALMINKSQTNLNITVIESKEIGILGAGEGSTPQLVQLLNHLDISMSDLISNCDATIKNGIKFTNWNNDNDFFYHGFRVNDTKLSSGFNQSQFVSTNDMLTMSLILNNKINEVDFVGNLSEINKVPFISKDKKEIKNILDYENLSDISIHFNASKLANRLKEIGLERGIKIIDGVIDDICLNDIGHIDSISLLDGSVINSDFVFDCSGFNRLIIGKKFNSKWKSYKDFLPTDSAVPFFISMADEIPPYTEAIAMKYGWMWKIPLQNRFGCGYVYDSSLISESEAIKEIEDYLGYEPLYPRKDKGGFKFSAGCHEESWINNCIAIGLSSNFVEPLEATSIWVSAIALSKVLGSPDWILSNSDEIRKEFNKSILSINDEVSSFIYFHYMSNRKDTAFWQKFSYENASKYLKEKLNLWKHRLPNKLDGSDYWPGRSGFVVGSHQETINKSLASTYIDDKDRINVLDSYSKFIKYQDDMMSKCVSHNEFLDSLK
jgi:tryptophan halogenase